MRRGRCEALALAVGMALLFGATDARAAVTVGQVFAPAGNCAFNNTSIQSVSPGDLYTVPSAGVITAWSHQGGATGGQMKFKVVRPVSPVGSYVTVGESPLTPLAATVLETFATRIPVLAGDRLGYAVPAAPSVPCMTNTAGYEMRFFFGDPSPGTTAPYTNGGASRLDIAARLEADADGDGFGDETQDSCPTNAATQGACPAVPAAPPDTTITKSPKAKVKQRKAKFEFVSTVPGSSFECAIDGTAFACVSPLTRKVGFGKHKFQVHAKAPGGQIDATPAVHSWKVKRKPKT